jgi:hypothetical protein
MRGGEVGDRESEGDCAAVEEALPSSVRIDVVSKDTRVAMREIESADEIIE